MTNKITISKQILRTLILSAVFLCILTMRVSASDILWDDYVIPSERLKERLLDNADLLSDSEEESLLGRLDSLSASHGCDIAVLTVKSHPGPVQDFADDYLDYNGFGSEFNNNAFLFMVSMDDREWAISSYGDKSPALTDYGQEKMVEAMMDELGDGDFYAAFVTYADTMDKYLELYEQGTPYDVGYKRPKTTGDYVKNAILGLLIGLIAALFPILSMKSGLKTVKMNEGAFGYQSAKGIKMTSQVDRFINKTLSKTPIPKDTGSRGGSGGTSYHSSSSGRSHGGSHGHF
ncbi:MAG: TPM domain-containing protein [Butyrivibrio sp.]|nr:TPM domain-containing protein [Butyrivibrio sp.]